MDGLFSAEAELHQNCSFNTDSSITSETSEPIVINISNSTEMINQLLNRGSNSEHPDPTTDEIEAHFPKILPTKVTKALESKAVEAHHKTTIVQKVVDNLYGQDLASNKCIEKAAKRMTARWSPLKVPGVIYHKGLQEKMRRRRDRLNEKEKRKGPSSSSSSSDAVTPFQARERMKEHWTLGERAVTTYRANMAICRNLRKDEAKKLPGLQLLRSYPCLTLPDLLLEEFEIEMGLKINAMETNWTRAATKLMQYMTNKAICVQAGSLGEKTLCILEYLYKIPVWYKKNFDENRATRVLEVFEATTPIAETLPKAKDPPRLIVHGRELNSSISCFLDTEPLFCVEDRVKALLLLLATYYVLGIKFPPHTRLQLILLCCCTVGATPAKLTCDISRNNKLIDLLKELSVSY